MGEGIFNGCSSLSKVKLSYNNLIIPKDTFSDCVALKEVNIPDVTAEICESAFSGCKSLSSITIPEAVTDIGNTAFYNCSSLTEIIIPQSVKFVGNSAFYNCDALQSASILGRCEIDTAVFYDCDKLQSLTLSDNVLSIGAEICYSCDSLTNILIGYGIKTIPDSSFRQCQNLTNVKLPRFCEIIETNAFSENTKLSTIYIPPSVIDIEDDSFSYPAKMTAYGKSGSYAEEYANSRNMKFNAVNAPITSMSYADKTMSMSTYSSVMPKLNIEPDFDTDTIIFSSSNKDIVTVADNGIVESGWNYGTAKITATASSGKTASIDITVLKTADSIRLDNSTLRIERGKTGKLTVTISPSDAVDVLEWSSSNSDIAEVDQDGNVTAKAKGTAVITVKASYSGVSATCTVTVYSNEIDVEGIALSRNSGEVVIGTDYPLTATISPANATNKNILWTSSDETVATVSNGVITALSTGTTTITATTADGGFTADCEITVIPKTEIVSFAVEETDKFVTHLTASNVPNTAVIWIAAYDENNRLVGIQSATLHNGTADTEFDTPDAVNFKTFVWYANTLLPLVEYGEDKNYFENS